MIRRTSTELAKLLRDSHDHAARQAAFLLHFLGDDGATLFTTHCAGCHGVAASGTDKGPPLVHRIYEPGHHPDGAFLRAATFTLGRWNGGDAGAPIETWPYQLCGEGVVAVPLTSDPTKSTNYVVEHTD